MQKSSIEDVRSKMLTQMSMMIGVMVTTTSLLLTVFREKDLPAFSGIFKDISTPIVVLVATMAPLLVMTASMPMIREILKVSAGASKRNGPPGPKAEEEKPND